MNKKPVALAFGSNLGDHPKNIEKAFSLLSVGGFEIDRISSFVESEPVDCTPESGIFTNGALTGFWTGSPHELMCLCQSIEKTLGRKLIREINSPRPIDLDILLFAEQIENGEDLVIPHKRMHLRDFVILPLAEIAPDWLVPSLGKSVRDLAEVFK